MKQAINEYEVITYEEEDSTFRMNVYKSGELLISSKSHTKGEFFNYLNCMIEDKKTISLLEEIYNNRGLTNEQRDSQYERELEEVFN